MVGNPTTHTQVCPRIQQLALGRQFHMFICLSTRGPNAVPTPGAWHRTWDRRAQTLIGMSICTYHILRVRDRRGLICADAQRSIHERIPNTWNPTPLEHLHSADRCHTSVRLSGILIQPHLSLLGVPIPLPSIQGHMYRWPPVPSPETLLLPGDVGEGSSPEL